MGSPIDQNPVGVAVAAVFRGSRSAYTLLEMVLALSLTGVVVGLIGMAIHVHLGVAEKSRIQVDEAILARSLLLRIAEDLRNAIPLTSQQTSSSGSSDASTSGTSTPGGICGSLQCLQVDTSRRARPKRLQSSQATGGNSQPALSDIKTVTYSLGDPGILSPTERGDAPTDTQGGLYCRELERAECAWARQQGQTDILNQATDLLAGEVVDVQFTYYDGTTTSDTWDSTQQGKLPSAVKVAIRIRHPVAQPLLAVPGTATGDPPPITYDMLVDLPNSQVQASQTASEMGTGSAGTAGGASNTPSSAPPSATIPPNQSAGEKP